jgi:hypothetical protein
VFYVVTRDNVIEPVAFTMLTPWHIPSEASIRRGQLKHSWLENQILNKRAEDVLAFRHRGGWPALENEFAEWVRDAQTLAAELTDGFGPAQLIDTLTPFQHLSEEDKQRIKGALHAAYLENSGITALQGPLQEAAENLDKALNELLREWRQPAGSDQVLRAAWSVFVERAISLKEVLERLPRGIVLP